MAPGEEDYKELVDDVFVRDIEVVLHGRDVDIAIELDGHGLVNGPIERVCITR